MNNVECVWKSEDNFVELIFFPHFYMVARTELRLSGLHSKPFYLLSHVTRPGGEFSDDATAKAAPWGYTVKESCDCNITVS